MTNIKFCGLMRPCDVSWANEIRPQFAGFVFWQKSKRLIDESTAAKIKSMLDKSVTAVGVFVDSPVEQVAALLNNGTIDMAQLHGSEDENYVAKLRALAHGPVIKAFKVMTKDDLNVAKASSADFVLLDAGMGGGKAFDWSLLEGFDRRFFLAGGLDETNVAQAIKKLKPFAVDVSSGIETNGFKDKQKMARFAQEVRRADKEGDL